MSRIAVSFVGCVLPPQARSPDEVSDPTFEFTQDEVQARVADFAGLPIWADHDSKQEIGTVKRAWIDPKRGNSLMIEGCIYSPDNLPEGPRRVYAHAAIAKLFSGEFEGLSLGHRVEVMRVDGKQVPVAPKELREISLCQNGRRFNTRIVSKQVHASDPFWTHNKHLYQFPPTKVQIEVTASKNPPKSDEKKISNFSVPLFIMSDSSAVPASTLEVAARAGEIITENASLKNELQSAKEQLAALNAEREARIAAEKSEAVQTLVNASNAFATVVSSANPGARADSIVETSRVMCEAAATGDAKNIKELAAFLMSTSQHFSETLSVVASAQKEADARTLQALEKVSKRPSSAASSIVDAKASIAPVPEVTRIQFGRVSSSSLPPPSQQQQQQQQQQQPDLSNMFAYMPVSTPSGQLTTMGNMSSMLNKSNPYGMRPMHEIAATGGGQMPAFSSMVTSNASYSNNNNAAASSGDALKRKLEEEADAFFDSPAVKKVMNSSKF